MKQRQGQHYYCPYLPCKLIFLWKQKEFSHLGFAITNIVKIFNKCNFRNGYLQNILRKKEDFSGGNKTLNQISSTLI